jgi:hypothetical protein
VGKAEGKERGKERRDREGVGESQRECFDNEKSGRKGERGRRMRKRMAREKER